MLAGRSGDYRTLALGDSISHRDVAPPDQHPRRVGAETSFERCFCSIRGSTTGSRSLAEPTQAGTLAAPRALFKYGRPGLQGAEPSGATSGDVKVNGPDGVDVKLTREAALETSNRLGRGGSPRAAGSETTRMGPRKRALKVRSLIWQAPRPAREAALRDHVFSRGNTAGAADTEKKLEASPR